MGEGRGQLRKRPHEYPSLPAAVVRTRRAPGPPSSPVTCSFKRGFARGDPKPRSPRVEPPLARVAGQAEARRVRDLCSACLRCFYFPKEKIMNADSDREKVHLFLVGYHSSA